MKKLRMVTLALSALLCFATGWILLHKDRKPALPYLAEVPDFTLIESSGAEISRDRLKGKVWIADFIFTSCAASCPMMTARMKGLQDQLQGNDNVLLVSFSVDPARDTPEVLREYAKKNGAVEKQWLFLTGEESRIHDLAKKGFLLGVEKTSGPDPVLHSQKFVLVDQQGHIRGYYDSEDAASKQKLLDDANALL